jgi:transposase
MIAQHTQLDYSGQHVYVGLDVHKKKWSVTIMTELLEHKKFTMPPQAEVLGQYLRRTFPGARYHSVYESGFCGFSVHTKLCEEHIDSMIVNPADVPVTDKQKRRKSDTVDSRKLATELRNGTLTPLYVPSLNAQQDRTLVRLRSAIVKKQTRCKNQIKSLLAYYGIAMPEDMADQHWSKRYLVYLRGLATNDTSSDRALLILLDELDYLRASVLRLTRELRTLAKLDSYRDQVAHLVSIPGISVVSAMILLTELVDIQRFRSLDDLASFVGLVPDEHSSGEDRTITDITTRRNPFLRHVLIEAAWVAVRYDSELLLCFTSLSRRMIKKQAIVRIARKVLNRVRFVLRNGQPLVSYAPDSVRHLGEGGAAQIS